MSYVIAAYLLTFVVVAFYVAYLVRRARGAAGRLLTLAMAEEPNAAEERR